MHFLHMFVLYVSLFAAPVLHAEKRRLIVQDEMGKIRMEIDQMRELLRHGDAPDEFNDKLRELVSRLTEIQRKHKEE